MNLLIISDLHLGDGGNFSTFGWSDDDFYQILQHLRLRYSIDKIVLNGDIYELYKYEIAEIENAYPKLRHFFLSESAIMIRGNHDYFLSYSIDKYQIINSKGNKIQIEHGHRADILNGTRAGRFAGRTFFKLLRILLKHKYLLKQYFTFMNYYEAIERFPRKYNRIKYLSYAIKLLKDNDIVILGHTHKLEIHKTYYLNEKKLYLNTGTCSVGRFQAILLDTENLKFKSIKLSQKKISKILRKEHNEQFFGT